MMAKINITRRLKDIFNDIAYYIETNSLKEASIGDYFYFLFKSLLYTNEPRTVKATEEEVGSDGDLLRMLDELSAEDKLRLESELKLRMSKSEVKEPNPELYDVKKALTFDEDFEDLISLAKYYVDMKEVTVIEKLWGEEFDSEEIYNIVNDKNLSIDPEDLFAAFMLDNEFNEDFSDFINLFGEFGITRDKFENYFSPFHVSEEGEMSEESEDFMRCFIDNLKKSGINLDDHEKERIKNITITDSSTNGEESADGELNKQKTKMAEKSKAFERISKQVNQLFDQLDKGKKKKGTNNIITAEGVQGSGNGNENNNPSENDPEKEGHSNQGNNPEPNMSEFEEAGHNRAISTKIVDPNSKTPTLDQFAVDMTASAKNHEFDPVVGRDKEIEQIIEILCCRKKNNAVLTGDPGCGKTAIVEALATRITEGKVPLELRDKRIFSLDLNALVSGTQYRGQYEQRLQDVIKEVTKNREIIIFIDELHNLIGNGSTSGSGDGANILKPYLARGEFQCIGSTTNDEYRKYIEKDGALKRRFSPVLVEEPTVDQTIQILKGLSKTYGDYHHVKYSDEVLEKCVVWSGKYINDRFFPDKAISVLDMASSLAKLNAQKHSLNAEVLDSLQEKLTQVNKQKAEKLYNNEIPEAEKLRDVGLSIKKEIEQEKQRLEQQEIAEVTVNDVSSVISKITNVPIDNIMSSDLEKIKTMKSELERKIIGQDEAVKQLTMALQRNIFGLRDPKKPIASFLFVGPTGVGKALVNGTPVLTNTGWRGIETLQIGDLVATPYHGFSPVIGVFPQGEKSSIYRITFKDGRFIETDENHLWLIRTAKQKKRFRESEGENTRHSYIMSTKDLYDNTREGYQYSDGTTKYSIPINGVELEERRFPIPPYVLGVLLGDGCLRGQHKKQLLISGDEVDILEKCSNLLNCDYRVHKDYNYTNVLFGESLAGINKALKEYGLNCLSSEKYIPNEYLFGSINQRLELLRGLFDTDGHYFEGKYNLSTSSPRLKDDIISLCRSLGYVVYCHIDHREDRENDNYRINISTNDIIFSSEKHWNKYNNSIERNRKYHNDHLPIINIEKIDNVNIPTTCIAIEDRDELFITKDYLITHNTHISKLIAKEFMGSENNLITIACSEYMQDWAESKLLGSAPGYVGYTDSEPRLYVLKRKPYSVILIDEVEKSSSNLYNIWLNMLEEGEITLSTGEKISCRNSIVIFTGNVGTKALELKGNGLGFGRPDKAEKKKSDEATVMKEVTKEFRPEFLNRLTKIVVFNSLGEEELDKIFGLELGKLQERIKESQGFDLLVNENVKKHIVSQCEPKYGARSLQRLITEYIEDSINNAMLEQEIKGKHIMVEMDDEENVKVSFS